MRPAAFFTGIGGMVVVVGLLMAGETRLSGASDGDDVAPSDLAPKTVTETPQAPVRKQAMPDPQSEALADAPAQATSPEVPAQAPAPAEPVKGPTEEPAKGKSIDLPRPVVESAGILSFGERQLQLADIVPTPDDKTCGSGEQQWPCGMIAKTQLRLFLRSRTVSCDLADADWKDTATAACRLGAQDIGAWLAESGWAEVPAGSPLADGSAKAKAGKLGLYGEDPRKTEPPPPELPSAEPTPDPMPDPSPDPLQ